MANEPDAPTPFSLRRWSQRKLEVAREAAATRESAVGTPAASSAGAPPPAAGAAPATAAAAAAPAASPPPSNTEPPLPPVDTLTIDSDFAPFLQPKVAEDVKRAALKKLFSDPQFNVMDGLDIYIGDYTQPDPMPAGMLDKLGKVYGMLEKPERDEAAEGATALASAPAQPEAAAEDAAPATEDAPLRTVDGPPAAVDAADPDPDIGAVAHDDVGESPRVPPVVAPTARSTSR